MQRRSTLMLLTVFPMPALLAAQGTGTPKCAADNVGLKLPAGFCAMIFADTVRGARELTVAPNGDVFVSTQGRGGGGVVALRDADKNGEAEVRQMFASGFSSSHVALFDGYLYAEAAPSGAGAGTQGIAIVRYSLKPGELTASGPPDTIVAGLPRAPGHMTRNFAIANDGS